MEGDWEAWHRGALAQLMEECLRDDAVLDHVLNVQYNLLQDLMQEEREQAEREQEEREREERERDRVIGFSKLSTMELKSQLWSRLPTEIVERVLLYLPVPDLCRFRTVCKRWNSLICTPEFGNLCIKNANQDSYYIVWRYFEKSILRDKTNVGWCILDLNARRWYTFKEELVNTSDIQHPLAMDGGLVCQHWDDPDSLDFTITVSNPLGNTTKVLPIAPSHRTSDEYPHVNLVVDNIFHTYKIFLINRAFPEMVPEDPVMRVFESTTNQWRSLANPPQLLEEGEDEGVGIRVCSVMFQGLLYVLFKSYSDTEYRLFSYNPLEDTWKDTGMNIQGRDTHEDILVVSGNRLFLVTSSLDLDGPLGILELLVANRESKVVFQMRRALVLQVFNVQEEDVDRVPHIQAFGFGKSIMLTSRGTGFSIVYDLETCSWDLLPTIPVKRLRSESQFNFFCGKPMRLRLPNSLW